MNAEHYLTTLALHFEGVGLNAVMIGNAAAAINGAPVTTLDVDFMLEKTDDNFKRLAFLAQELNFKFIEMSLPDDRYIYRLQHRTEPFAIDFIYQPLGLKCFSEVWSRGMDVVFDGHALRVASLDDVITSKRAAGRPKDLAVLPILEMTLHEKNKP